MTRQPGFVPAISRPIQILDTLPMSMTDQHSYEVHDADHAGSQLRLSKRTKGLPREKRSSCGLSVAEAIEEIPCSRSYLRDPA